VVLPGKSENWKVNSLKYINLQEKILFSDLGSWPFACLVMCSAYQSHLPPQNTSILPDFTLNFIGTCSVSELSGFKSPLITSSVPVPQFPNLSNHA
jgi:hypothetical protein